MAANFHGVTTRITKEFCRIMSSDKRTTLTNIPFLSLHNCHCFASHDIYIKHVQSIPIVWLSKRYYNFNAMAISASR